MGQGCGGVRGAECPESERRLPFLASLQGGRGREAPERATSLSCYRAKLAQGRGEGGTVELSGG